MRTSSTTARRGGETPESRTGRRPAPSLDTFRADPLYPRIERAVAAILEKGKVVAPVDLLVEMGLLTREHLEDWRRGRVPYLEKVVDCNLTRLSRLLRILRFHAHDLRLVPSVTAYARWGKGPKKRLHFTKHADPKLEEAYSRHFVWPGKCPFRRQVGGVGSSRVVGIARGTDEGLPTG
jgi:hypothetical protein